jgi:tight adherence protein B
VRRTLLTVLLVVAALAAASTAAAQPPPTLTETGGTRFPFRSFVLTVPDGAEVEPGDIRVLENGRDVSKLAVVPADEARTDDFGVVVVIDASDSMRGNAIDGAMAAARSFVERRNANQQIAVVTFNADVDVLLPFTTDRARIDEALSDAPALGRGTHVRDAVEHALALIEQARIRAGSIVVLSDGADTGSAVDHATVAEAASKAGVRVFAVGLRGRGFTSSSLEALADDSGGEYAEASSPRTLEQIFDAIGSRLASEYLVRYRSLASAGESVRVEVVVDGAPAGVSHEYSAPELPAAGVAPYRRPVSEAVWLSPVTTVVVALLAAALLAVAAVVLFRRRKRDLRARMAEFVTLATARPKEDERSPRTTAALAGAERKLSGATWWARFNEQLEVAEIRIPAIHIVAATAAGTLAALAILYAVVGSLVVVPVALVVPLVVRSLIRRKIDKRRNDFAEQLPDNLQVLASALRAGHSLVGSLSVVVDDAPEPARGEFRRLLADEQLGVPLEDAFGVVVKRMESRDLEQVALVAALQRETGGNTAEVLDNVCDTIRARFEIRRLVKTLTAQGRMARWIVSLLPVALLVLISVINPSYVAPLFTEPLGRVLLVVAGVMVVAGSLLIKRIVNIKV